ncbi:TorF family putative porin [Verrucomicrobiota bacterium]
MKKMLVIIMMVFMAGLLEGSEVSVSVDVASAYVFRGATFNDGLVVQPGLEVAGLVTFGVWGNLDIDDYDGALEDGQFSELDIYASYDLPLDLDPLGLSVGYTEYLYPSGGGDADREISLSAGFDFIFSPSLAVFYGIDGGIEEMLYIELGLGHEFPISSEINGEVSIALGYVDPDGGDAGFSHADVSASVSYKCLSVGVTSVARIDKDVLPDVEDGGSYDAELVGSLGVGFKF